VTGYLADAMALVHFYEGLPLAPEIREILSAGDVAIAATTVWELRIKIGSGKLADIRLPSFPTLTVMFREQGFSLLDLTPEVAEAAARLPLHPRDPFDRALIAASIHHARTIITGDGAFAAYGVATAW
jgi:PIN domain nuclease of toxin-antitoxin system